MFYLAHVVVYIGFFNISNFSSIFSILLIVSRLRAGELSEPLGFLVSSPYNVRVVYREVFRYTTCNMEPLLSPS